MTKQLLTIFLILFIFCAAGCDSGTQTTQNQDIGEIQWQSDGSAIFGYIQSYALNINTTQPPIAYSIAKFNTDGSLAQTYNSNGPASRPVDPITGQITESYSPSIYLSPDGSQIVTQLENDLYRYNVKTNVLQKLDSLQHLITVSPDLHYTVSTNSPQIQPIKTIYIYDILNSPIRLVKKFDIDNVALEPGLWLANTGMFAITCYDSTGAHVDIFDTTGSLRNIIGGAETAFHNVAYNTLANDIFLRNWAGKSTDQFLDKINLSSMTRTNILNFQVENFDITADEQVIIYSAKDTINSTVHGNSMKIRNLQTLKELPQPLATDIMRYVVLSHSQDRVAYVRGDINFNQIQTISFARP